MREDPQSRLNELGSHSKPQSQTPAAATRCALTIEKLHSFVRIGSNHNFVRWWAHWNYPQNPTQMAISIKADDGRTLDCTDLERVGFERYVTDTGCIIYVCDRVDDNGNPFRSRLV